LSASSKRLLLEGALEVARCDDEGAALAELNGVKVCAEDEPGDCTADNVDACVEGDAGFGGEVRLLDRTCLSSRSILLGFAGGAEATLMFGDV
jgi:hypothetical protein